ncbi:MAG TPA: alpha/beta family hydrolase [Ignavibacteriaceae bacterium]|nr:alpha/beta family hydrolase [Ignavibacteriaceae bacterium]
MRKNIFTIKKLQFEASKSSGNVSAIIYEPREAKAVLVLAHGAGAGMNHPFMESLASKIAEKGIAVLRYNFAYIENKKRSPDPPNILMTAVKSAVLKAGELYKLPVFAGGKSLGGRMTSNAASKNMLPEVKGIIFFGFPLHAPGKPSNERAEHLYNVNAPMLFIQGTRDKLAELSLLNPVIKKIGDKASIHIIEGADHSFHVPRSLGKSDEEVLDEIAGTAKEWISRLLN